MTGIKISNRVFYGFVFLVSLFIFFYPEKYKFLPFSTLIFVQIAGVIYSIYYFYSHPLPYPFQQIVLLGVLIFCMGFISSNVLNHGGDLDVAKRGILMISYIFTSLWLIFLLRKSTPNFSFFSILEWITWITLIQAAISIIFFLVPSVSETYRSYIQADESAMNAMEALSSFRLIGIGDVKYATGAVQYGLVMWGVIALRYANFGFFGKNRLYSTLAITIFTLTGIMSGRVYFVILCVTVVYILSLNKNIIGGLTDFIKIFTPTILLLIVVFVYLLSQYNELISWAFELFINYGSDGYIESESTNQLKDMYLFPDNIKTWLIGDGRSISDTGFFYMGSDVGYIRSIFYWGLTGSFIYYVVQYRLYRIFSKISPNTIAQKYVLFIVLWLYIYSLKDFYSIERFLVLFIVVQVMACYNGRKNKVYDSNPCIQA